MPSEDDTLVDEHLVRPRVGEGGLPDHQLVGKHAERPPSSVSVHSVHSRYTEVAVGLGCGAKAGAVVGLRGQLKTGLEQGSSRPVAAEVDALAEQHLRGDVLGRACAYVPYVGANAHLHRSEDAARGGRQLRPRLLPPVPAPPSTCRRTAPVHMHMSEFATAATVAHLHMGHPYMRSDLTWSDRCNLARLYIDREKRWQEITRPGG